MVLGKDETVTVNDQKYVFNPEIIFSTHLFYTNFDICHLF